MSGLSQKQEWLNHTEAAGTLGVNVRTIERWVKCPATRDALRAVRDGRQWRIPRPENRDQWRSEACWRLKKLGIELKPDWERNLDEIARSNSRHWLESNRLWLACYAAGLERGRITQKARDAILLLYETANEILAPLPPNEMQVDKLKEQFPVRLSERGLSKQEVGAVMRYWPGEKHFRLVRAARRLSDLEAILRRLDYTQAVRELKHLGKRPTHANIGPLVHRDMMAHRNDTRERLPRIVVRNPAREQVERITLAIVWGRIAGKKPPSVTLDFRQPQKGLKRRTVQKRHPQKRYPQRTIVAGIYRIRATVPGADQKPHAGKTPIRKPSYDGPTGGHSG